MLAWLRNPSNWEAAAALITILAIIVAWFTGLLGFLLRRVRSTGSGSDTPDTAILGLTETITAYSARMEIYLERAHTAEKARLESRIAELESRAASTEARFSQDESVRENAVELAKRAEIAAENARQAEAAAEEVKEIVRERFEDWEVRCAPDGTDCFIYQLARDNEGEPIAEFTLLRLPEGGEIEAGVTVVTPLGTLLPPGVVMQVDATEAWQYPFAWCNTVGCFARFGLVATILKSMKTGHMATLTVVSVENADRPINLDISLRGFEAAYDSLEVSEPST